jgi:transposase
VPPKLTGRLPGEVQDLRREARALKECVADLTRENRLLKKSMIADGADEE